MKILHVQSMQLSVNIFLALIVHIITITKLIIQKVYDYYMYVFIKFMSVS